MNSLIAQKSLLHTYSHMLMPIKSYMIFLSGQNTLYITDKYLNLFKLGFRTLLCPGQCLYLHSVLFCFEQHYNILEGHMTKASLRTFSFFLQLLHTYPSQQTSVVTVSYQPDLDGSDIYVLRGRQSPLCSFLQNTAFTMSPRSLFLSLPPFFPLSLLFFF